MSTHFLEAHPIQVLHRRENGSGVIEIPIMATATGSEMELTVAMMQEMVANFDSFPLVPVSVSPHKDFNDRGGFSAAFIESIDLRGDRLFGRIDLAAELFNEVVELGGWRGFSVEIAQNLKTQAKSIDGWVLTGGVFTNRPAVDAHFKIAAEGQTGSYTVSIQRPDEATKGATMAEDTAKAQANTGAEKSVSVAFHDEKMGAERDKCVSLEAAKADLTKRLELSDDENRRMRVETEQASKTATDATNDKFAADAKVARLEAQTNGLKDKCAGLTKSLTEAEAELAEQASVNLSARVLKVRDAALEAGVPPAIFEGIDADPAQWMNGIYASFEAFEKAVSATSGVSRDLIVTPAKSGVMKGSSDHQISAENAKRLRRLGLDPKYAGISTEAELEGVKEAEESKS